MMRRVFIIAAFLLSGLVLNVLVAWWLATTVVGIVFDFSSGSMPVAQPTPQWSFLHHEKQFGTEHVCLKAHDGSFGLPPADPQALPRWSIGRTRPTVKQTETRTLASEVATGWPLLTLHTRDTAGANTFDRGLMVGMHELPLRPIWLGLATNTIFYAFVLYGAVMLCAIAWRRLRRSANRRRRGLCPDCGYDLRGAKHVKCPECGTRNA